VVKSTLVFDYDYRVLANSNIANVQYSTALEYVLQKNHCLDYYIFFVICWQTSKCEIKQIQKAKQSKRGS